MEFYNIRRTDGQYHLVVEDGLGGNHLTGKQFALLLERLSGLYGQGHLLLAIRAYALVYYSNEQMEYVSLKEAPGQWIAPERLATLFGADIVVDGFATTFLEGEEENRVWIGSDGVVENRGISGEKVKSLLLILVEALNQ